MKTQTLLFTLLFLSFFSFAQDRNDLDLYRKHFQFSLITPPLSTNGVYFHKTVNDISINTFLGISAGTRAFEVAGFSNINLYYSKGIELAGFANISGILPSDYNSHGIMASGFANINGNKYTGVQASGFANVSNAFSGVQAAGFANINLKTESAVQAAGFANATIKADSVFQAAGFANIALDGEVKVQAAGFGNVAKDVDGVQAAGFMNVARNVKGVQVSGFINVCDSLDGVAISFINIVRKNGYRSIEFSLSDWAPFQATYKMGTKKLYNVYSLSKLANGWDRYAFGFGFGHSIELAPATDLNLEVINHHAFSFRFPNAYGGNQVWGYDQMLQFKPTIKKRFENGMGMSFGPTLNFNRNRSHYDIKIYQGEFDNNLTNGSIQPFWKVLGNAEQNPSKVWVGFTAGISLN